ncbi:hypothetical protein SAMN05216436_11646 [bacterium A37T11]|nr:hypothetical protein SAMN05216436_11646 [bacterium A37T11]
MNADYEPLPLIKNTDESHFELTVDGYTAFILYKERPGKIWLIHTESPPELAGRGVATTLIEKTLAYLDENHFKLVPLCPMIVAYIKRHPEWNRLVVE